MSTGWFLHKIDEYFLEQHDSTGPLDINTALEMLNIKKFLDSGARLIQWGTRQVEEYKRKGNKIPQYIGSFCGTLSDANFSEVYSQVEIIYADDFWELVCTYKVYVRISPEVGAINKIWINNCNAPGAKPIYRREVNVQFSGRTRQRS